MSDPEALYPIREISRLTGVTPITLRAWERRYELIEPVRTDSGHRLYTQSHVDFIKNAVELTKQGIPISKVKGVLEERKEQKKTVRSSEDINFVTEIITACHHYDFIEIQQLVEQAFVDLLEEQVNQVLIEVSLQLQDADAATKVIWNSVVIPLLSSRIRQGRRLLDKIGRKNIYVETLQDDQGVIQRIMSNLFLKTGYNPMLGCHVSSTELLDVLKNLHCQAMVLILPDCSQEQFDTWKQWSKQHASIEFYLATANSNLSSTSLNFKVIPLGKEHATLS